MNYRIILYLPLFAIFLACSGKPSVKTATVDSSIRPDSLSNIFLRVTEFTGDSKPDITLTQNTMLTFFQFYHYSTNKSSGISDLDSNTLKAINHPDRQQLYKFIDQYGFYKTMIEPRIDSQKVEIIETPTPNSLIVFSHNNKLFKLDLNVFRSADGIILYSPGKMPIVWTTQTYNEMEIKAKIKDYFGK